MQIDLSGRVCLVTGAANGIGRAIAATLASCGARIAAADIDAAGLEQTAAQITAAGGTALAVEVDVTDFSRVQAMVEKATAGLGPVDVMVNSAAMLIPPRAFHTIEQADWERVFDVDVKGLFYCCKAVAPQMIERRKGRIINLGSVAGKIPRLNMAAYCAAKAAVIHLSKVIALELAPFGINVICHCPGTTETDMVMKTITGGSRQDLEKWLAGIPLGRFAKPQDQADVVAFLASDYARHITGQAINVDGGQVMW